MSSIRTRASRGALPRSFACFFTQVHRGSRLKETDGVAEAGGSVPSAAGGAAVPALNARCAVRSARNSKRSFFTGSVKRWLLRADGDVLLELRPERGGEPGLGLGEREVADVDAGDRDAGADARLLGGGRHDRVLRGRGGRREQEREESEGERAEHGG